MFGGCGMIVLLVYWETTWIFQIWLLRSCTKEAKGTWRNFLVWLGRIWYNRNHVLYEANGTSEAHIWGAAIRMIEDFKEANGLDFKHKMDKKDHWEPPSVGFYVINVDGAIPLANGHSGIGIIVRDSDCRFFAAVSMLLQGRYSVEETEAIAVEQGCVLAKKLGLERVIIETDSLLTVQAVEANDVREAVGHIVKSIVQSLCSIQESKIRHINRTSNKIAHELAEHARRIRETFIWSVGIM
ncbi:uncharacterized protein LOC115964337 [Quercus lobata]|uniref:uncharacterized protein LOC115964337 n=1 Tax=Quercus lobata TaxID=97700 RepID=UPI0012453DA3|nr:uncharacterized protein LOC115964337 [Quercus lobata]